MTIAIHINAGNDRNGNPKRGWIITNSEGEFIDFVDEGYAGTGSLRTSAFSQAKPTPTIEVAPSVYRDCMRQAYGALPSIASQQVGTRRRAR
jgi:hypothetical protein